MVCSICSVICLSTRKLKRHPVPTYFTKQAYLAHTHNYHTHTPHHHNIRRSSPRHVGRDQAVKRTNPPPPRGRHRVHGLVRVGARAYGITPAPPQPPYPLAVARSRGPPERSGGSGNAQARRGQGGTRAHARPTTHNTNAAATSTHIDLMISDIILDQRDAT